jgi:hypothetical protein
LAGRGKRGGARVILAFKLAEISVFIYGFSKNQKDKITDKEKEALKSLAKVYFAYSKEELKKAIKSRKFVEVLP